MADKTYRIAEVAVSLFSLILLLSNPVHAATTTDSPNANSIVKDDIEYYIETDKAVYDMRENVQMLYRVTNVGEENVQFIFTYGPLDNTCDWMVDEDELRIWDNLGRPGTAVMTYLALEPSQSYEYTHTWDMTDKNGDSISSGNYTVTGVLGYPPSYERYVPVSVFINIIQEPKTHYVNPGESIQTRIDDPNVIDGDTIKVYPGTYIENINFNGKNITLSSTDPNDPNVVAATIIDGSNNGSVVTFDNGEDANCVLNGFTITNGSAEYGGGIYCTVQSGPVPPPSPLPLPTPAEPNSPSPTIKNCIICNNWAEIGGGMCIEGSNPALVRCTFSQNSSDYGGGLLNSAYSDTMLTDCNFNDNSALVGGGFYNHWYSTITLTNCTLYNNLADDEGGGAYNVLCTSTMTGCIFSGNTAYHGGGMYNDQSTLTLINCTFTDNSAPGGMDLREEGNGGAMFNYQSSLNLTNCAFNENSADYGYGGGIYNNNSEPIITNCKFSENSAYLDGGGMYNYESNTIMANCNFIANLAESGAGIDNLYNSSLIMINCMLSGNSSDWGGGISNDHSSLTLLNCTFTGNFAVYNGGGIYNTDGVATLANCILWENMAEYDTDEPATSVSIPALWHRDISILIV